jgi:hypothetical protein
VASTVRHEGERARQLAARVRGTGELAWRSPAADVFRARVHERVRALLHAAAMAEAAADAVEEHAAACDTRLTALGLVSR